MEIIKLRKISTYTGKGLTKWNENNFKSEAEANEFIKCNQSATGAFNWIGKKMQVNEEDIKAVLSN